MKHSKEGLERIRQAKLGKNNPRFGKPPWNKGKPLPKRQIEILRATHIGRKWTKEALEKRNKTLPRGELHHNWKGGITPINRKIRLSFKYRLWREAVFARDNFTCVWCGLRGGYLEPDHIKPFCDYPELRFAIDNGRTLCKNCHSKTDTYKGRMNKGKKYKSRDIASSAE